MRNVQDAHAKNYEFSKTRHFVPAIVAQIHSVEAAVVRIHANGDFYSVPYIRRWRRIIEECSNTQFYAYTRSWRLTKRSSPELVAEMQQLSRLPNMRLWLSCDAETGRPPSWRRSPAAYLSLCDDDYPQYPVDLIFRENPAVPAKRLGGFLVCPHEQGMSMSKSITCKSCGVCFQSSKSALKLHAQRVGEHSVRKARGRSLSLVSGSV